MNPHTKLFKFLEFLYNNRGKKFSAKEISQYVDIPPKGIEQYRLHCNEYVSIQEGRPKLYYLNPNKEDYIKQLIKESLERGY